ncbi:hypothetical protein [Succinivibrio sp.]|uniref:hypothetical protein n=1 Tax=Succinivibrio sp. TaxID=2053619 RepID=UPI0025F28E91|nr:hypothetical protein [Succinivibrio sp.]MBQ9220627.1 hypothetical protein [Succinivibrio sp.]
MSNLVEDNKKEQKELNCENKEQEKSSLKDKNVELVGKDVEDFKLFVEDKKNLINKMLADLETAKNNLKDKTTSYIETAFASERDNLAKQSELLVKEKAKIEEEKLKLTERERNVSFRETEANNNFPDRQEQLRLDYESKREELENKFNELKNKKQNEYDKKIDELEKNYQKKQQELQYSLEKERQDKINALNEELKSKIQEIEESQNKLSQQRLIIEKEKLKNEQDSERNELRAEKLDLEKDRIEETVNERISMIKEEFNRKEEEYKEYIENLRQENKINLSVINDFNDLKAKFGNVDPAIVIKQLKELQNYNQELRNKISSIPSSNIEVKLQELEMENSHLKELNDTYINKWRILKAKVQPIEDLRLELKQKENECQRLDSEYQATLTHCARIESELSRLKNVYGSSEERAERLKAITSDPDIKYPSHEKFRTFDEKISEINWLEHIISNINEYGLSFPRRLVYAFHTCLKIAEWSPITVLAGVSGTGKSELPRFYSLFGGLKFLPVSVQPNWDSQESMLGFFNTIDNKFDAQPLLKFLFQITKAKTEEYPNGLKSSMNMVLLDEMNLAHIELYFAEFLSKLESRRGRKGVGETDLPTIDVKLGANIEPYKIPLTRNLLWVGTMNQDETTKSLSDKVLDRGNVLFFPRPVELKRRENIRPLPSDVNYLLPYKVWRKWTPFRSRFTAEQIEPYKNIVEKINASLEVVGRAIGHRVWQSIEYYMSNYPTIDGVLNDKEKLEKNMDIAFADALVQKVMPKLRGIETRGIGKEECLDKINMILGERELGLQEDFSKACENAYGQFIWNSANYLLDDSVISPDNTEYSSSEDESKEEEYKSLL